ncbi:MAG: DUF3320 domain-containing protein [Gordonia sp. (in: high G+C Gram-positive bacteria)]
MADLMDTDEQARWLTDPAAFNRAETSTLKAMSEAQTVKMVTRARTFDEHPRSSEAASMLALYLEHCMPAPRRTEFHGWSVSSGTYGGYRLLCVSIGKMESFVVFSDMRGFLIVHGSTLFPTKRSHRKFTRSHPWANPHIVGYEDSAGDAVSLDFDGLSSLQELIHDPAVGDAASRLTLNILRKHSCVYTRYHCPQVVQRAYPHLPRDSDIEDMPTAIGRSPVTPAESSVSEAPSTQAFRSAAVDIVGGREVLDALPDPAAARQIRGEILQIIEAEGPIELSRLIRTVARRFSLDTVRTSRAEQIGRLIPDTLLQKTSRYGTFAWPPHLDPATWRDFRTDDGGSRSIEEIAPQEIANAMRTVTDESPGIDDEALLRATARVFGITRMGVRVRARLEDVRDRMFAVE